MRDLKKCPIPRTKNAYELYTGENALTIFEKIEFSNISKETLAEKLRDLRGRQVPQRTVFLESDDEEIVFYWFRNWLHPNLKHFFPNPPSCQKGASKEVRQWDAERASIRFYENGQHHYLYTLADIEDYIKEP